MSSTVTATQQPPELKLSTTPAPLDSSTFLSLMKLRRSQYGLTPTLPVSAEKIQHIVSEAVLHTLSAYNSQTNRAVVLLGDHHAKLWNLIADLALPRILESKRAFVEGRFAAFREGGVGSILFWEDHDGIKETAEKFSRSFDEIKTDATVSDGMLQFAVWTALAAEGVGASLQHNVGGAIQEAVRKQWSLLESWHMNAQMVFGGTAGKPLDKTFKPLDERFKVFAERNGI